MADNSHRRPMPRPLPFHDREVLAFYEELAKQCGYSGQFSRASLAAGVGTLAELTLVIPVPVGSIAAASLACCKEAQIEQRNHDQ